MKNQIHYPKTLNNFLAKKVTEMPLSLQDKIISCALQCLESRLMYQTQALLSSDSVKQYLQLQLASEVNEVFAVLFLDAQHRVLAFEKIFFGTINSSVVYPRVIMQRVLAHNAAAVILAHNHPSGITKPSENDREMTQVLKQALRYLDTTVLDHVIVSQEGSYSFADEGLLC